MPEVADPPAAPLPGWYADPGSGDELRYWDGQQWTEDHRPVSDALPTRERRPSRLPWPWMLGALAVLVIAVVVLILSSGSPSSNEGAAARQSHSSSSTANKPTPSLPTLCNYPEPRLSASALVGWFRDHSKLPTEAKPQTPTPIPSGGCSAAAFADSRTGSAVGVVVCMPTAEAAAALALSYGANAFVGGDYVVKLDSRMQPYAAAYQASIVAFGKMTTPVTQPGESFNP